MLTRFAQLPRKPRDGAVLFGAEVVDDLGHRQWDVFVGNPEAQPGSRITRLLKTPITGNCVPRFNGDPYPAADAEGAVAFTAPEAGAVSEVGRSASYTDGKLA